MVSRTHLRIFGYTVTILMHVTNIIYMDSFHHGDVMEDPKIRTFVGLQGRFITCWNFFFQIVYAFIGLACDLLTLKNSNKDYNLPSLLSGTRNTLFSVIVWPTSFVVFTLFWPFYLYDIALVYPDFIDKILTPLSNHIIHTAIVPVVLWEIVMLPRYVPESHRMNLTLLAVHALCYFVTLIKTYLDYDFWLYPVIKMIQGSIYFPLLFVYVCALLLTFYYMQWIIVSVLWGSQVKGKKTK